MDVKDHRPRCVRHVRHMNAAIGELPHQPRVDRPAQQLARGGPCLCTADLIEDPAHLRRGEVGIDDQTGAFAHEPLEPSGTQRFADLRARAALPHHRGVDRAARRAFPDHGGLALVRDPDGRDVLRADPSRGERSAPDRDGRREDLVRVVLDMTRCRVALCDLAVGVAADSSGCVEHERGRSGGPLVERQDEGHFTLKRRMGSISRQ